jgi:hypothetical protein
MIGLTLCSCCVLNGDAGGRAYTTSVPCCSVFSGNTSGGLSGALSTCQPALLVVNSDIMPKKCTTWATLTTGYTVAQLVEALRCTYTCVNGKVIGGRLRSPRVRTCWITVGAPDSRVLRALAVYFAVLAFLIALVAGALLGTSASLGPDWVDVALYLGLATCACLLLRVSWPVWEWDEDDVWKQPWQHDATANAVQIEVQLGR